MQDERCTKIEDGEYSSRKTTMASINLRREELREVWWFVTTMVLRANEAASPTSQHAISCILLTPCSLCTSDAADTGSATDRPGVDEPDCGTIIAEQSIKEESSLHCNDNVTDGESETSTVAAACFEGLRGDLVICVAIHQTWLLGDVMTRRPASAWHLLPYYLASKKAKPIYCEKFSKSKTVSQEIEKEWLVDKLQDAAEIRARIEGIIDIQFPVHQIADFSYESRVRQDCLDLTKVRVLTVTDWVFQQRTMACTLSWRIGYQDFLCSRGCVYSRRPWSLRRDAYVTRRSNRICFQAQSMNDETLESRELGRDKGDTRTFIKCSVVATRRAPNSVIGPVKDSRQTPASRYWPAVLCWKRPDGNMDWRLTVGRQCRTFTMPGLRWLDVITMMGLQRLGVVTMPGLRRLDVVTMPVLQRHDTLMENQKARSANKITKEQRGEREIAIAKQSRRSGLSLIMELVTASYTWPGNPQALGGGRDCEIGMLGVVWNVLCYSVVRLLASHLGEQGSITGLVTPGKCESCRTIPLVGGFSLGSPVFPPLHSDSFLFSPHFTHIGSQDLVVKSRPNLSTQFAYAEEAFYRTNGRALHLTLRAERLGLGIGKLPRAVYKPPGAAVTQGLESTLPTKANWVRFSVGLLPDFRPRDSCRTMPLVGGLSLGPPVSDALAFRCCSILNLPHPHRFSSSDGSIQTAMSRAAPLHSPVPRAAMQSETVVHRHQRNSRALSSPRRVKRLINSEGIEDGESAQRRRQEGIGRGLEAFRHSPGAISGNQILDGCNRTIARFLQGASVSPVVCHFAASLHF
ncbi:hypothetical protein PR048_005870 [Dryococelus australis]|uniref:Uncharacterized protein n=1 Tax=Dryococelus australis TaxID=614101 RepID=A0ABQ9I9E7_9NEOP|nr:hypothetical protein PR048_005870 [Dryococelus australis]